MIKTMYLRRIYASYILSVIVAIILLVLIFFTNDWLGSLPLFVLMIGSIAIIPVSHYKYNQVKDLVVPQSEIPMLQLDHLVIQRNVAYFPQLLFFQKDGSYVGTAKLQTLPWYGYLLSPFFKSDLITILPFTYTMYDESEREVMHLQKRGWFLKSYVTIMNEDGHHIGSYEQEDYRIFSIQGKLKDATDQLLLPIHADFTTSFTLTDDHKRQWASFYQGRFPHEYTHIFRDMENHIVELSDSLEETDHRRLLGVLTFLFLHIKR
ncbi:hypothetical protein ACE1TF_16890 [Geomicrobium sp. JSM 1781026]|uniref:hypothetical protein n=1 Tax=Geomicrobium sp. JSM 1781026 TaxID=3344580 RepID=UPI0035C0589B